MMESVVEIIIDALMTDGAHHKQWSLEQVLLSLIGEEGIKKRRLELVEEYGWVWERGIAP